MNGEDGRETAETRIFIEAWVGFCLDVWLHHLYTAPILKVTPVPLLLRLVDPDIVNSILAGNLVSAFGLATVHHRQIEHEVAAPVEGAGKGLFRSTNFCVCQGFHRLPK